MNGNGTAVAAPQSVAEAEELVKRLYLPGPAKIISQINDQLLQLQHSADGWQLADALMSSDDQNVRFFAANTFTVKLNNDGSRGDTAPEVDTDDKSLAEIITGLDQLQILIILWFSATLADEVSRVDSNAPRHREVHERMEATVQQAGLIMARALNTQDAKVRAEGLKCYLTWVNYAQPIWPRSPDALQHLRDLIEPAAQILVDPVLQHDALDVFRDILESYTSFFQQRHMQLLGRIIMDHVQPKLLQALQDQDPEVLPYGQMVTAFGVANVQDVVENPHASESAATVIRLHFDVLRAPGYPGDEDELSVLSIEFWNTYVEYVNDTLFSQDAKEPPPLWLAYSKSVLSQLVGLLWTKMCTPTGKIAKEWTDAENEGFKEFRLDATDLMLSIYVFLGKEMLQQLVSLTVQSLHDKRWRAVEAALFCLNAVADNVLEDQAGEDLLTGVFSSSLFREVGDFAQTVPSQARRTAIDVLGSYGPYIERHAEYLPDTVRFLFASLETGLLANTAAKSIAALCSACRGSLTGELDGFLLQYQRFTKGPTSDPYTKEKVIGAIAAIIQALKPERAKVRPLLVLIESVDKDLQAAKDYSAAGDAESAETFGVMGLTCLASIGKNLQLPEDVPINIYDDDEQKAGESSFWDSAEAQEVRQRIMGCFSVLQVLGDVGEAIEAACHVLRSGFAETEPGPFVLPASVTVSFLQQCSASTPQLEIVLSTACILITQHSKAGAKRIPAEVSATCEQVASFMQQLQRPGQDPGVAQGCIDVFSRLMPCYTSLLFESRFTLPQLLPTMLNFTIQAIESQDIFPKRAAAEFWAKLIKPQADAMSQDVQQGLDQIVSAYGPQLSLSLMRQIGGNGQRSEIDFLCEPLKALIANSPAAKGWLEAALFSESFAAVTDRVSDAGKRRFLQQIVGLRGDNRKTKEVVREFYATCRGTVVSYG
ncbi:member of the karyopherin-beta [Teratosphaeriaceae sp. CCFEE 6253]|nr:member of the karyopherin-beta [Teratosphaeriaceae sp. CCFEE 6253]